MSLSCTTYVSDLDSSLNLFEVTLCIFMNGMALAQSRGQCRMTIAQESILVWWNKHSLETQIQWDVRQPGCSASEPACI